MKRFFALPLLACLTLLSGCDQIQEAIDYIRPSDATLNGYTVERDANGNPTGNVDLNVSALDANGEPIAGEISNPVVTVDNVVAIPGTVNAAQRYSARATIAFDIEIQEIINGVLDIDQSGSMQRTDPERQRVDAAQSFIGRITDQDRLAVMTFRGADPGFRASALLQDFTGDQTALNAAVERVGQKGGTPIWDSVLDTLDLHSEDEGGEGSSRVVVLFTDGQRDGGNVDFNEALSAATALEVKFFTVGLGSGEEDFDAAELQELAEATGGTFANVEDADGLEELFNKVFNAIRASGVITVNISPVPPAGSLVTGRIQFDVNGETFDLPYAIQF
jgi:Ca-activated chloride channel family protein